MQKLNKTQIVLERPNFVRFSSAVDALMSEGVVQGQIVQYAPGKGLDQVMGFKSDRVAAIHTRFPHLACIRTGQPKGCATFTLPVVDASDWVLNGVAGGRQTLFVNFGLDETELCAPGRNLFAISVEIDLLLETMSALAGSATDEADIPRGPLALGYQRYASLVATLNGAVYGSDAFEDRTSVEHSVTGALAAVLLSERTTRDAHASRSYEIFFAAKEALSKTRSGTPSLAGLCEDCGVSVPTLTAAFLAVTGTSPMRYARQLRLSQAHRELAFPADDLQSVKRVARRAGFSELGQFNRHYRNTYGQLPSEALNTGPGI